MLGNLVLDKAHQYFKPYKSSITCLVTSKTALTMQGQFILDVDTHDMSTRIVACAFQLSLVLVPLQLKYVLLNSPISLQKTGIDL